MTKRTRQEIERLGLIVVHGSKHHKIVCPETGRLVGVTSHGTSRSRAHGRQEKNLLAALRRFEREREGAKHGTTP